MSCTQGQRLPGENCRWTEKCRLFSIAIAKYSFSSVRSEFMISHDFVPAWVGPSCFRDVIAKGGPWLCCTVRLQLLRAGVWLGWPSKDAALAQEIPLPSLTVLAWFHGILSNHGELPYGVTALSYFPLVGESKKTAAVEIQSTVSCCSVTFQEAFPFVLAALPLEQGAEKCCCVFPAWYLLLLGSFHRGPAEKCPHCNCFVVVGSILKGFVQG